MIKQPLKIGFIGLGLIGGSLAKSMRHYFGSSNIVAYDKNKESLALALMEKTIDVSCEGIDDNFSGCDYIFLCAPVSFNSAYLKQVQEYVTGDCILSDVGSVKSAIHEEVERLGLNSHFIGGHPMTGSEKSGYSNSKYTLFENAYYILTPTKEVALSSIATLKDILTTIKALPHVLDYAEHDKVTGIISHLPHILAATLVDFVAEADGKEEVMKPLLAGGFRDITRIASSSPTMWQQICLQNSEYITSILDDYISSLCSTRDLIKNKNNSEIYRLFEEARDYRNSVGDGTIGAIKKYYAIYCDIIDETGGIASIANILAENKINLKNIGIVHNREFEEGVLRIEFYEGKSSKAAVDLLQKHRYVVYEY
ncbi:MAG: prephenate dehydrogenase/arogenate dehydrogenase family protein [Suipraeoptans sp.]